MTQPRCKKCGRPLSDPDSIARGMGPECAGISGSRGKSARVRRQNGSGSMYNALGARHTVMPLFAWVGNDDNQQRIPDQLARFPPDLLDLVLSAPAAGTIAMRVKSHRRKRSKQKGQSPIITLKEIRRMCINLRMLFWPGFSFKGEPLACIPCGDDHWRIGRDGREISAGDLLSYLSRYGVI
jgi:uncharacterized protein DUF6011